MIVSIFIILYQGFFALSKLKAAIKIFSWIWSAPLLCTTSMSGWAPGLLSVEGEILGLHLDRLDITRPKKYLILGVGRKNCRPKR